jgi:hypothetical protein
MDIWDTAYTLAPGHRLRLWLSSADTPTHEPLEVAGRNLIFHDADHPSQLVLNTRAAEPPCGADPAKCPPLPTATTARTASRCTTLRLAVPRGLRHVRVTVAGKRARTTRHDARRVVVIPARTRKRAVVVRITGVDRHGRRVTRSRRYAACS